MGATVRGESFILTLLSILLIWVGEPTNETPIEIFGNPLLKKTTMVVMEEYIQEYADYQTLRLTDDKEEADIYVYPVFINYIRPNTEVTFATMKSKTETVGLEMEIVFYHKDYNIIQKLHTEVEIDKEIRSNFLSVEESDVDFANSLLMNLVKKAIASCFEEFYLLIF